MWRPPLNFITLHYAYILSFGILALATIYPKGHLAAVDAYFFGVSSSTESGLNTVDVKDLKTYQQMFLYFVPIVTNLGFVNIAVVVVRLQWFRKRFKNIKSRPGFSRDATAFSRTDIDPAISKEVDIEEGPREDDPKPSIVRGRSISTDRESLEAARPSNERGRSENDHPRITFAPQARPSEIAQVEAENDEDAIRPAPPEPGRISQSTLHQIKSRTRSFSKSRSVDRALSSVFVLGKTDSNSRASEPVDLASLSRDELGGIEYQALRVLLKVTVGYFFGLHLFGALCLVPWIHLSDPKYREYLASLGQDKTWWGFYSSQTMVSNLGFTLTPDSMIKFQDATWPLLVMTFLAFAGNTFYPIFLRLVIWTLCKLSPTASSRHSSLRFLLDHPRRCYTLLFPGPATWALFVILILLNFVDVLLIITLDLTNPELTVLPAGPRVLAALFQAASARHTGTAVFNLANVNPAVQFSLLVMMYISIYPIAISIRMSAGGGNEYEDGAVGVYGDEEGLDERGKKAYLLGHMRNQLSFDLWYIFLGVFCICCAESERIMDLADPAFSVFSIFFEVVSAYGNVGLSLGHPSNSTSLSGHFTVFGKLVICAMMIRGRHRGMPYSIDRAISLPSDRLADAPKNRYKDDAVEAEGEEENWEGVGPGKITKAWTQ